MDSCQLVPLGRATFWIHHCPWCLWDINVIFHGRINFRTTPPPEFEPLGRHGCSLTNGPSTGVTGLSAPVDVMPQF